MCTRCATHNLRCSYVVAPGQSRTDRTTYESVPSTDSPATTNHSTFTRGNRSQLYGYNHRTLHGGHDIGAGTPSEILREGELTYELILLYFSNFDDIHFMFDKDIFLRQLALGEVPKVILYSMMALGIR